MASAGKLAAFAVVVLFSLEARAQQASAAQVLFEEGRRLVAAGDVAAGCAKLAESQRLDPAGGTLINLAACHERQGKTATAWTEFNDALTQAKRDGREERVQEATRRIEALAPRLSRLTVNVQSAAAGLEVKIDGTVLGTASWGTPIPVDPGDHELRASAPANRPWSTHVTIAPAASQQAVVPPLVRAPVILPPVVTPAETGPSGRQIVAYAAGGIGIVALGLGTYFGVVALNKKNDSEKECSAEGCTQAGASLLKEASSSAWVANIGVGVGLVALAAGTILLLTAPRARTQALFVTPDGLGGTW